MNEPESDPKMENKCPQCGATLPTGALGGLCPACLLKQGATAETAAPTVAITFQPPSVDEVARLFPQLEILAFIEARWSLTPLTARDKNASPMLGAFDFTQEPKLARSTPPLPGRSN